MGYIIEITEDKVESLSEHLEKGLRHIGKAMQCVDGLYEHSERFGERGYGRYGNRGGYGSGNGGGGNSGGGGYGNRMGYREDDEEWDEDDDRMGERRGRSSRSERYMRR